MESPSILSKKDRYYTIIATLARSLHKSLNLQDVLENAVRSLRENIYKADCVAIYTIEGQSAFLKAQSGFNTRYVERAGIIPYPKGFIWKTINEERHLYTPDVDEDGIIGPAGRELGIQSYLSMPIYQEGKATGAIAINSFQKDAFSDDELDLLEIVKEQIEIALRNARQAETLRLNCVQLEMRVEERTAELTHLTQNLQVEISERAHLEESLKEKIADLYKKKRYEEIISSIAHSVHQSINLAEVMENAAEAMSTNIDLVDNIAIYLIEGETAVLKTRRGFPDWFVERAGRIQHPKGITWQTIMDGKPRYCADVDQEMSIGPAGRELGIKSYLSMPIFFGGKTIGTLNISSFQKKAFGQEELELLERIALQIEMAINNAQIAEELRESEERYRILFNQSPVGVYIFDTQFRITQCNQSFIDILQSSYDRVIGLDLLKIKDQTFTPAMKKVLQGQVTYHEGFYEATTSPVKLWLSVRFSPLLDSNFRVIGGMGVVEDITEAKQSENALRRSEEKYKALYENNPLMCFTLNSEAKILSVNQFAVERLGYTPDELIGQPVTDVFPEEDKNAVLHQLTICMENPAQVFKWELRKSHKDGSTLWVNEVARIIEDPAGSKIILVVCEDITKRKQAEESLQKALTELEQLKNRLQAENTYLQEEIKTEYNFEEIIGHSLLFRKTLHRVEQVASTDSTVLIQGETGTGKELIARLIHNLSRRKGRPLVKVNCGAISAGLVESELFGHEKGAFTGAVQQRLGRFELANGGTIFLDEVGELPPETQVKLLRVVQWGEFERVGSSKTIKIDVRVIAATNKDLDEAVKTGLFRSDLYYRLNVFPLEVPPLRDRREDIPLLTRFFVNKYAEKLNKSVKSVSCEAMNALVNHHWPGNVRELENIIERAMIVASDGEIAKIDNFLMTNKKDNLVDVLSTFKSSKADFEKYYVSKILQLYNGNLTQAAKHAGIDGKELWRKMRRYGIKRELYVTN